MSTEGITPPPLSGIARKKRSDAGTLRKSSMDTLCDSYRRMSPAEQQTALEVLRQISRIGAPQLTRKAEDATNDAG